MSKLPKVITAQRSISYTIDEDFLSDMAESNECEVSEITLEMIVELIAEWADESFNDYIPTHFYDDEGNEIEDLL
jgi:hypothetical protein